MHKSYIYFYAHIGRCGCNTDVSTNFSWAPVGTGAAARSIASILGRSRMDVVLLLGGDALPKAADAVSMAKVVVVVAEPGGEPVLRRLVKIAGAGASLRRAGGGLRAVFAVAVNGARPGAGVSEGMGKADW